MTIKTNIKQKRLELIRQEVLNNPFKYASKTIIAKELGLKQDQVGLALRELRNYHVITHIPKNNNNIRSQLYE